jgi:hypothetical protein
MHEIYRMLGAAHEAELERIARGSGRSASSQRSRRDLEPASTKRAPWRRFELMLARLTALLR